MSYSPELIAELEVLMLFDLSSTQEGIKVHKTAEPEIIAAAKRLHDKGFVTQVDGGYLTSLGTEAAEHGQNLFTLLTSG
ncbi:MAG: TIGR02647 family protein [Gammaproteobacteria bacterium]|nr:TIGR02647 family protein [Gammaproteobacteria bacterium]